MFLRNYEEFGINRTNRAVNKHIKLLVNISVEICIVVSAHQW